MAFLATAIQVGVVMIILGVILNIINRIRHGDFLGAVLDKFGACGLLFYGVALALVTQYSTVREYGLTSLAWCVLAALPLGWIAKDPIDLWIKRRMGHALDAADQASAAMESMVNIFEGLLSYFANTISFVRLAAYAMSHAALLLSAFMIADDIKHARFGGTFLSLAVIILGNAVAIVLEGIVASVQALRLEYYEFFGKFFSGRGRAFEPFRIQTNPMAQSPP